ncbi:MAG TPA: gluconeogenesis factor YvcK family protein [Candidatus Saccharimonadales bacterium]|nr:gluconeogenesis factor YvcK family protein [Candidatus Saccharimonadales bacterium]
MRTADPRIVVIGGGTGGFTLLGALKKYSRNVTALVNMADDGGSTGQLRDELGVLPPGDVRKSLVALSESPKVRDLFNYRFTEGAFEGHTFGNLFLSALEKLTGNFAEGVETASEVLDIVGEVMPITLDNVRLVIEWPDGTQVRGEGNIDTMAFAEEKGRPTLRLDPLARINPAAAAAIRNADLVVISAGDIYTSLGSSLAVDGVYRALKKSRAKVAYVSNLVTKPGQTDGFTVSDHAAEIERLAGGEVIDFVLYNTARPPEDLIDKYLKEGEYIVEIDRAALSRAHYKAMGAALLDSETAPKVKGDPLAAHRSLIRHDGDAVARRLVALTEEKA